MRIDGSYGEGGGQILRTAVVLSCILGEEIEVVNIRKGRKTPGLRNQHIHGIKLAAEMCNAQTEGLKPKSTHIKFIPGKINGGRYEVDVGTAGSISLILQTVLPVAIASGEDFEFVLKGGTDVPFSPPIDYYVHALFPLLRKYRVDVEGEVLERGYYPEGGGMVRVMVRASDIDKLMIPSRGELRRRTAYFNMRKLPMHIANRIRKEIVDFEFVADVRNSGRSRGCSLVLVEEYEKTIIAGDCLCRRGLPAERVARIAIDSMGNERTGTVDEHMADHLPVFVFIAGEVQFLAERISKHTKTNLWLLEQFGAKTEVREKEIHAYI